MKINLKALTVKEIEEFIGNLGQKPYRAKQIINWIYKKSAASFEEMTDLPHSLREILQKTAYISNLNLLKSQLSKDGTRKFLYSMEDGEMIESVLIPDNQGKGRRLTLCVSSQVGCAMGCRFCLTGRLGLKRNLKAYEIIDQIIAVNRIIAPVSLSQNPPIPSLEKGGLGGDLKTRRDGCPPCKISNIVFMGMGEPLHNFEEVLEALRRITGILGFSKRRVTLSTAGIVPKIDELAKRGPQVNLAVSLNATTDEVRNRIMPVNRKYPIKELINACKRFPLSPRRRITFEYVLLNRVNDSEEDAFRLVNLLKGIKSKVNLIPYNPIYNPPSPSDNPPTSPFDKGGQRGIFKGGMGGFGFKKPEDIRVLSFEKILIDAGITAIIRKSKGRDIQAACGQLKAGYLTDIADD